MDGHRKSQALDSNQRPLPRLSTRPHRSKGGKKSLVKLQQSVATRCWVKPVFTHKPSACTLHHCTTPFSFIHVYSDSLAVHTRDTFACRVPVCTSWCSHTHAQLLLSASSDISMVVQGLGMSRRPQLSHQREIYCPGFYSA